MPLERRRVHYSGRVQGVGFRFTCQRIATGHAVVGYVRNLQDGGVELVVEGQPAELDAYLAAVAAAMDDKIWSQTVSFEPAGDPPFSEFSIRH